MKVLFLSSGNKEGFKIIPFIKSQGDSLLKVGIDISYFVVNEKGIKGYLKTILLLREHLRTNTYDLIHSHYVLTGWVAVLGNRKLPIICSFMGSDTYGDTKNNGGRTFSSYGLILLAKLIQPFLSSIIVKSENLYKYIWCKKKTSIVPNGIDFDMFVETDKLESRKKLGLDLDRKYILFLGNSNESRKNFRLAEEAMNLLGEADWKLLNPYPVKHSLVPIYLSASDVLVLTSYLEGSPNVLKEAMACNCPVVTTEVGDINWLIGKEPGHYIAKFSPQDFSDKLKAAINYAMTEGRTKGRQRIKMLGLDSETVAFKIIKIYEKVL